jgi:hypothetical protein
MHCRGRITTVELRMRPERRVMRRRRRLDGGDAGSWWSDGGELEVRNQRKKMKWGKRGELPPLPYLYRGVVVVGTVGVLHYPDRSCRSSPCGGMMWGGGSNNRATRRIMAVIVAVINGNDHSANHHLM